VRGKDLDTLVTMQLPLMMGLKQDPKHYVHRFFTLAAFRVMYSGCILSLETTDFAKLLDPNDDPDVRRIRRGITPYNGLDDDELDAVSVRNMIHLEESSSESEADVLLPPNVRRPPGCPKKQRIQSGGEHVGTKIKHCSRCGEERHTIHEENM
jgi:hypothetical protein